MEKLSALLSRVLRIDEGSITDVTSPDNVDSWDSFTGLILVSELESNFQVKFTMEEVSAARCVKDIKHYLRKHGVVLEGE